MKYTRTKQGNIYYFRYKGVWYKTESNLKDETLIVTEIDTLSYEYRTKLLNIQDKSNIYFYTDFENLLIDYDTERWNEDREKGQLKDHHERRCFQNQYNLDKVNRNIVKNISKDNGTDKFEAYKVLIKENPNSTKTSIAETLGVTRQTIHKWALKINSNKLK